MMKIALVLLAADAVTCWWFVNSVLMLAKPGKAKSLPWWPQFRETAEAPVTLVMSRKKTRTLGIVFAVASGILLFAVLTPATLGLVLLHFKR